MSENNKNI